MANKFVTALFGDYSKKEIKKLRKTIDKINSLGDKYAEMGDKELTSQTQNSKTDFQRAKLLMTFFPKLLLFAVRLPTVCSVCVTLMFSLSVV